MKINTRKSKYDDFKVLSGRELDRAVAKYCKDEVRMSASKTSERGVGDKNLSKYYKHTSDPVDMQASHRTASKLFAKAKNSASPYKEATALLADTNFVEDLWETKLFLRYSAKMMDAISEYISKAAPMFSNNIKIFLNDPSPSLSKYITELLKLYLCFSSYVEADDRDSLFIFDLFAVSSIPVICSKEKYKAFLDWICNRSNSPAIHDLVDKVIRNVIKNDLRCRVLVIECSETNYSTPSPIKKENLMQLLPAYIGDLRLILTEMLTAAYYEISLYYDSTHSEDRSESILRDEIQTLEKRKKSLTAELSSAQEKIADQERTIAKLRAQIGEQASVKPDKPDASEVDELRAQNDTLAAKYDNLLVKYNQLKDSVRGSNADETSVEFSDDESEQEAVPLVESSFDTNLPLLFVSDKRPVFEQNIKQMFPNAEFTLCNGFIDVSRFAAVVMVTTYISHSYYKKLKDLCKRRNVPYIHSSSTNAEIIKGLLEDNLK